MDERFDCIIVGGGIAGLSAAMVLARARARFLLIERGEFAGAKNVSGGVLWGTDLARLVPDYWHDEDAFERFVRHRRLTFMDERAGFSVDFKSDHFDEVPYAGVTVLRSRFDRWFADRVQEAIDEGGASEDSFIATNVLVDGLLQEDGTVVGIRAGEESFFADVVILAEGVNNLLTRKIGLQDEYVPADHVMLGVKEVVRMERKTLEDRFQLDGRSGFSNEFVGFCTGGVEGGGFIYTNRDSISVGLVLGVKDLREKGARPHDLLNAFKAHPVVHDMIRGGEEVEYSAHAVSSGDMRLMPREVYADGVLVAGEAANLLANTGRAIQGMDYAMRSGILAAETVVDAKRRNDFSAGTLRAYRDALEAGFVLKDMRSYQGAVRLLHDPHAYGTLPAVACDFGRRLFTVTNEPTPRIHQALRETIRRRMSYRTFLRLAFRAARSL